MPFNRDEFICLLTNYYEFCNRVFWEATVRQAPQGGWPSITKESMAGLGKNETSIDVLRHMPYLEFAEKDLDLDYVPIIMDQTPVIDYRHNEVLQNIRDGKIEGFVEPYNSGTPISSSCVCIATSLNRNGYFVVLDTNDGYIYWGDPNGQHDEPETDLNNVLERYEGDKANEWRAYGVNVYCPVDFFALCKERFQELRWIGLNPWHISALRMNVAWDGYEEHAELVNKMRAAGWPGNGEGGGWDRARFEASVSEVE